MSENEPFDDVIVCPLTHSPLVREGDELVAQIGGLRFPIRDGIPVLLIGEARLPDGVSSLEELKASLNVGG